MAFGRPRGTVLSQLLNTQCSSLRISHERDVGPSSLALCGDGEGKTSFR